MSSIDTFIDEVEAINRSFPGFEIRPKAGSWLCKVLNAVLWVLSFGQTKFMTEYVTVLGKTMYTPTNWEKYSWLTKLIILKHERIHLEQANRMFFGWSFWVGWSIWALCYLFVLPFGLTLRARWEREAYEETIRLSQRYGVPVRRAKLFRLFTSWEYFYMDLRRSSVSAWLDRMGVM